MKSTKEGTPRYSELDNVCYYYSKGWTFIKNQVTVRRSPCASAVHGTCFILQSIIILLEMIYNSIIMKLSM